MGKPTCQHCESELDEINEDTGTFGVWTYDAVQKKFIFSRDECADSTTFYCPSCHNEIKVDIEDNKVTIKKEV